MLKAVKFKGMSSKLAETNPIGFIALIIVGFLGGVTILVVLYLMLFSDTWPETEAINPSVIYQHSRSDVHPDVEFSYTVNGNHYNGLGAFPNCSSKSQDATYSKAAKWLKSGVKVKHSPIFPSLYRLVISSCP
jgi:hypothetical protein